MFFTAPLLAACYTKQTHALVCSYVHRDAWSSLYRLIEGSDSNIPWHVYPEQVQAEAYCQAFPRDAPLTTTLSASDTTAGELKPCVDCGMSSNIHGIVVAGELISSSCNTNDDHTIHEERPL